LFVFFFYYLIELQMGFYPLSVTIFFFSPPPQILLKTHLHRVTEWFKRVVWLYWWEGRKTVLSLKLLSYFRSNLSVYHVILVYLGQCKPHITLSSNSSLLINIVYRNLRTQQISVLVLSCTLLVSPERKLAW
jgi:hypothetical protein